MMSAAVPYSVPQEPGRWQAIALAVIVHAVLFTFLWIGINWVNNKPETIEAEVWSTQELEKAPPPVQPPEPVPVVKETPREVPVVDKPDIALERDKKMKRLEKERKERDEKLALEKAEKKLADDKKKVDEQKKLAEDKRKQDLLAKKIHDEDIKRMTGDATKLDTNGTAARSQGSQKNAAWISRVSAKIKSNIVGVTIPASDDNNTPAEFVVGLLPDGTVAGIRKTKSSGIPAFDDAVRRAIDASQPYPADSSGRVPSSFISTNKPKDQ